MMAVVERHHEDGITTLRLNRPEKRNAINWEMTRAIGAELSAAAADEACRCVVITGNDGHFAAGRDLGEASANDPLDTILTNDNSWAEIFQILLRMTKPSVAVVEGYAVAGGFTLAMGCDFVLAERGAKFGALEMRGGFPAAVNTAVLSNLLGPRQSLELLLSAELFDAEHLHRIGLINHLADGAEALSALAADTVARLVALDPIAVALTKESHRAMAAMTLTDSLVVGKQLNALLMCSGKVDEAAKIYAATKNNG
jgi:enoyl-CoA hydratase/carnithine racemase